MPSIPASHCLHQTNAMSSTNRGTVRAIADYYVTPVADIKEFLAQWCADDFQNTFPFVNVLDPCAGGTLGREGMSYPAGIMGVCRLFPVLRNIHTIDIRDDSMARTKADYLQWTTPRLVPDLIITNPPFNIAQRVVEKALLDVMNNGYVVMLLRLNYLGSIERLPFWQNNLPERIYVHSKRMKFLSHRTDLTTKERGATDSIEYAHFVWRHNPTHATHY